MAVINYFLPWRTMFSSLFCICILVFSNTAGRTEQSVAVCVWPTTLLTSTLSCWLWTTASLWYVCLENSLPVESLFCSIVNPSLRRSLPITSGYLCVALPLVSYPELASYVGPEGEGKKKEPGICTYPSAEHVSNSVVKEGWAKFAGLQTYMTVCC